jgi:RNA polymerase sigma factor (sigma-70 family)
MTEPSDSDLLRTFAENAVEEAFATLVRRHVGMVLGVCRRLLGDADAEDVAQSVFLALAAQARSRKPVEHVPGWLHRVARNLSTHRREANAARKRNEQQAVQEQGRQMNARAQTRELRDVLDEALTGVSMRYRVPLILHYFERRSLEDIANELQVMPGTVASWLNRGRKLLERRLMRLGVMVTALTLADCLAEAAEEVPTGQFVSAVTQFARSNQQDVTALLRHAQVGTDPRWSWTWLSIVPLVSVVGLIFSFQPRNFPVNTKQSAFQTEHYLDISVVHAVKSQQGDTFTGVSDDSLITDLPLMTITNQMVNLERQHLQVRKFRTDNYIFQPGQRESFIHSVSSLLPPQAGDDAVAIIPLDWLPSDKGFMVSLERRHNSFTLSVYETPVFRVPDRPDFWIVELGKLSAGEYTLDLVTTTKRAALTFAITTSTAGVPSQICLARAQLSDISLDDNTQSHPAAFANIVMRSKARTTPGLHGFGVYPGSPMQLDNAIIDELPTLLSRAEATMYAVVALPRAGNSPYCSLRSVVWSERQASITLEYWSQASQFMAFENNLVTLIQFSNPLPLDLRPISCRIVWRHYRRQSPDGSFQQVELEDWMRENTELVLRPAPSASKLGE